MIPTTVAGLVLFLAAVAPGYAFVRIVERRSVRSQRSQLLEAVDLLCVGAASTVVATLIVLLVGAAAPALFVDLRPLVADSSGYLAERPWQAVWSLVAVLACSVLLSTWLGHLVSRRRPVRINPGSVWHEMLRPGADRQPPYLAVELEDGRVFEGFAAAFTTAEPGQSGERPRDLALRAPLSVRTHDGRVRMPGQFLVVGADRIRVIHGTLLAKVDEGSRR